MVGLLVCLISFVIFACALLYACMNLDWDHPPVMSAILAVLFLAAAVFTGTAADRILRRAQAIAGRYGR